MKLKSAMKLLGIGIFLAMQPGTALATAVSCGPEVLNGDATVHGVATCWCFQRNQWGECEVCSERCFVQNGECATHDPLTWWVPVQKACTDENGNSCTITWTETYSPGLGWTSNIGLVDGCSQPKPSPSGNLLQSPCGCRFWDYQCQANCE
jgi:hypothetical protein